jgi:hypothetical protein
LAYHHENFRSIARRICDLIVDQLNHPVVTAKSLEQFNLVGVAPERLCICSVKSDPFESEHGPSSQTQYRIDFGRATFAEDPDPFVIGTVDLYKSAVEFGTVDSSTHGKESLSALCCVDSDLRHRMRHWCRLSHQTPATPSLALVVLVTAMVRPIVGV